LHRGPEPEPVGGHGSGVEPAALIDHQHNERIARDARDQVEAADARVPPDVGNALGDRIVQRGRRQRIQTDLRPVRRAEVRSEP
jgi:hypothetical protein